jgi:hypothetical protein
LRDTLSFDEISLTLPADEAFHRVAHLVMGGLAVRLDLTFELLEDLELALDALLERTSSDHDVTLRVRILDGELRTLIGPFTAVGAELAEGGDDSLNLRRILATVCDRVEITDHDGAQWVELSKRLESQRGVSA